MKAWFKYHWPAILVIGTLVSGMVVIALVNGVGSVNFDGCQP